MQFPNDIQAAVLFEERVHNLEAIVRTFLQISEAKFGLKYNVPEAKPGVFYRLFGGREMMITLEYVDNPPAMEVFQQPLNSSITGILCPDIREKLTRSKSLILVNVSHGVLGGVDRDPKFAALFEAYGRREGYSLPEFMQRLDMLALITRIVCDYTPATVVHWTQSNQLFPAKLFDELAASPAPSMLAVNPYLFGGQKDAHGRTKAGIRTFGIRHFIGREVIIEPNILPWSANYETILSFLRIATTKNGYIIPDNDTFGPEDQSVSYKCIHHDTPEKGDVPLYELIPLLYREFDFQSDDYVPRDRVFNDQAPPLNLMPVDDAEKAELVNEWREKRQMAEGVGGRFEVRARGAMPTRTPPSPGTHPAPAGRPGFGARPVFGRKRAND